MEEDVVHIWPVARSYMAAQSGQDVHVHVVGPYEGENGLNHRPQTTPFSLFQRYDVIPLLPNLLKDWNTHPVSSLVMTRCFPWNDGNRVALMGDSAHAIVPFYGQGMNSGMEDCTVLDALLEEDDDWDRIMAQYTTLRKPAGDAILELALQNYIEMGLDWDVVSSNRKNSKPP